jgi:acyl carrier protein
MYKPSFSQDSASVAPSQDDIAATIEQFICTAFQIVESPQTLRSTHLFESGYVDSVGITELIAFVESTFGIHLNDQDLFDERFTTIDGIAAIVIVSVRRAGDFRPAVA